MAEIRRKGKLLIPRAGAKSLSNVSRAGRSFYVTICAVNDTPSLSNPRPKSIKPGRYWESLMVFALRRCGFYLK